MTIDEILKEAHDKVVSFTGKPTTVKAWIGHQYVTYPPPHIDHTQPSEIVYRDMVVSVVESHFKLKHGVVLEKTKSRATTFLFCRYHITAILMDRGWSNNAIQDMWNQHRTTIYNVREMHQNLMITNREYRDTHNLILTKLIQ